jgi:hypothetical protein
MPLWKITDKGPSKIEETQFKQEMLSEVASKMMHNLSVNRTACKLRLQISSALRRPVTSNVSLPNQMREINKVGH